ncbi:MAG: sigma-70 family RNA polymerase sigma factor [Chloroflexota bacterium]|nr:MAG: sigma-70 family RNA polymerase sigma factor [Chloroflexota bacterium]
MKSAELYAACISDEQNTMEDAYSQLWVYLYQVALQVVRDQPNSPDLAQDCAQKGLIRIYERIDECKTPVTFLGWSRTIVRHIALDSLRRRKRLRPLDDDRHPGSRQQWIQDGPSLERQVLEQMTWREVRELVDHAPISDRSRRTIIGRYFDNQPDETLAKAESQLEGRKVLPSQLQVTRSKNLSKMRNWPLLRRTL